MKIRTFAKINLFLEILSRRSDGYHEISTIYQNVSIADELLFEKTNGSLEFTCEGCVVLPSDEKNLVMKAVRAYEKHTQTKCENLKITLRKNLPTGAGMGGGSSNAAGTLIALNKIYEKNLTLEELQKIAASVGMDVPFFICGGTAEGIGRGEIIKKIPGSIKASVVIIHPGEEISTPYAYSLFSENRDNIKITLANSNLYEVFIKTKYATLRDIIFNRFEILLKEKYSWITEIKNMLIDNGCDKAFLTGSGSAVIGLTDSREKALRIEESINKTGKYPFVKSADFIDKGWEIAEE